MLIRYLILELKNTYRLLFRSILLLVLSAALLFGALFAISKVFLSQNPVELVTVAVVIPKEEFLTQAASSYIEKMESVASVSNFVYTDEDTAYSMLDRGDAEVAMIIPENFYEAVDQGINPPVTVLFSQNDGMSLRLFRALLSSGEAMLRISESGVYAVLETAATVPSDRSASQIGTDVALVFMNAALNRADLFDQKVLSPLGTITFAEYYFASALLILLLTAGLSLGILYEKRVPALEDRLSLYGIKSAAGGVVRMICISLYLFSLLVTLWSILWILQKMELISSSLLAGSRLLSISFLPAGLLLCISVAGVFHLLYSLTNGGLAGGVLVLCTGILQLLCCGLLVPTAYLPKLAARIGAFLPASVWFRFLLKSSSSSRLITLLIGLLAGVCGILIDGLIRRDRR